MIEIFNLKYLKLNRYKVTIKEFWEGTKLKVFNLSLVKLKKRGKTKQANGAVAISEYSADNETGGSGPSGRTRKPPAKKL
jgi:hypothetical protein